MKTKITVAIIIITLSLFSGKILEGFFNMYGELNTCGDMNICKEGKEMWTEHGLILVNKENCLKYNWEWYEETKKCNMRYKPEK